MPNRFLEAVVGQYGLPVTLEHSSPAEIIDEILDRDAMKALKWFVFQLRSMHFEGGQLRTTKA